MNDLKNTFYLCSIMKLFRLKNIIVFIHLLFPILFFSQNWEYKKFTTSNGLMSSQIDGLFIDSKGLLWIMNGNGITRYNGKTFNNYLNDSMLAPLNKVNAYSIKELEDGSIFYSMKYGYVKTSSQKKYYLDIYLSDTLALENENGVTDKNCIRHFKKGYLNFDFQKMQTQAIAFKEYPDNRTFPSNLLCSNLGNVFYSFYNQEQDTRTLYLFQNNSFKKVCDDIPFIMAGIFETESHYFILPDEFIAQHTIIVIQKNNLSKAYIKKDPSIPDLNFLGNGILYNKKLIFPAQHGIFVIPENKEQIFVEDKISKEKLSDEKFFNSLYKQLYIWNNYVINGYRLLDISNYQLHIPDIIKKEMLAGNFVNEVMPDEEGNIWWATNDGLFQLFQLPYQFLYTITDNRVGEINDSMETNRFHCIQQLEKIEYCLTNDSEKIQILIPAVKDKFFKYDISTQQITPIYVQGLQSPILKERLYPLMSYKKLIICQEYTRGLVAYRLNKTNDTAYYSLFNYSNGLLSNYVENIFADKNENIWLITWDGIQIIHYNDLINENYDKAIRYSQSFRLEMIPFMKNNDIYFADGYNLYKIPTSHILYNQKPPNIVIENFGYKINNQFNRWTLHQDSIYQLPYNFDELSIHFFAVCLSDGYKVKYKYILDNVEHYQNEGELMLSDLSTGKHTIEIYASNNFNIWTTQPIRIYIEVLPPFWETWWFRITSVIAIAGIVVLIIKKREHDLKQKQLELERLVQIRTKELAEKNQLIEQKNTEILDSINYTQRLQKSSLPSENELRKIFPEVFVLYQPKDIIAGDFYFGSFVKTNDGKTLKVISVGDCTGHGVPGAFMSILLLAYIKQTLQEREVNSPADALEYVSKKIQKVLEYQSEKDEVKDSADMVFAAINEENILWCACANNPVYIVRNSQLIEIPAQKRTVGYCDNTEPFVNHTFQLEKNDLIYLFSDGYADQFGGKSENNNNKERKFTKKRFKELLTQISHLSIEEQKQTLIQKHLEWRGNVEQTDDICIVGIKV